MSKVEEGGGGFRLTTTPLSVLVTIFSSRLLGLSNPNRRELHLQFVAKDN